MSKKCKSLTNSKTPCSRKQWFLGFCKQHFKLKIRKYRLLIIGSGSAFVLLGLYSGLYQDLVKPIFNSLKEPDYIYCETDNKIRGVIKGRPRLKSMESVPINLGVKNKKLTLLMDFNKEGEFKCFNPYNELFEYYCPFSYRIDEDGYFYFNMIFVDYKTNDIGRVENNEFVLNQNCAYSWNIDDNGFEVVDNNFKVVFSIDFSIEGEISLQGVFYDGPRFITIGKNFIGFSTNEAEVIEDQNKLIPMFEYISSDYFKTRR